MGGSCITTVTAFLVVNAPRLGLGSFDLAVWLSPVIVGGIGLRVWRAYYERRFNGRRLGAASASGGLTCPSERPRSVLLDRHASGEVARELGA